MRVGYFHGLMSRPKGSKWRALQDTLPTKVETLDFRPCLPANWETEPEDNWKLAHHEARMEIARKWLAEGDEAIIVGISFGGLTAATLADEFPDKVKGLLLCCPALHWGAEANISHVPKNTIILHGKHDKVVPLAPVEQFVAKHRVGLLSVVDDNHRLQSSLPTMCLLAEWVYKESLGVL